MVIFQQQHLQSYYHSQPQHEPALRPRGVNGDNTRSNSKSPLTPSNSTVFSWWFPIQSSPSHNTDMWELPNISPSSVSSISGSSSIDTVDDHREDDDDHEIADLGLSSSSSSLSSSLSPSRSFVSMDATYYHYTHGRTNTDYTNDTSPGIPVLYGTSSNPILNSNYRSHHHHHNYNNTDDTRQPMSSSRRPTSQNDDNDRIMIDQNSNENREISSSSALSLRPTRTLEISNDGPTNSIPHDREILADTTNILSLVPGSTNGTLQRMERRRPRLNEESEDQQHQQHQQRLSRMVVNGYDRSGGSFGRSNLPSQRRDDSDNATGRRIRRSQFY